LNAGTVSWWLADFRLVGLGSFGFLRGHDCRLALSATLTLLAPIQSAATGLIDSTISVLICRTLSHPEKSQSVLDRAGSAAASRSADAESDFCNSLVALQRSFRKTSLESRCEATLSRTGNLGVN
jgi:hypothetical protein